ncbi:unnamed protein product [Effrenium voratum]|nr:unnamed protein product [Effrenium voratum]
MNLSTMTSFANFSGSEYMKKFMDLELVRDWSKLRDFEKTEVWAMANRTREASWELTRVVRSEAAGILDEVLVLLTATARNMADQLSSLESYALATGILTEHAVNDMADFYKKTVMVCVAVACGMALLAFVYACYLEYVYENNEVARAFETDPAARQGCCWGCVLQASRKTCLHPLRGESDS